MTVISVSSGRFKTKPLRKLFFPVLLKRNVRKRALRTLKEGDFFFFAGGYDRGWGISLIYWLPPPPSGLYKNTSFHKNLPANSLRNKIGKQPQPPPPPSLFIGADSDLLRGISHSKRTQVHFWKEQMLNQKGKDAGAASGWVKRAGGLRKPRWRGELYSRSLSLPLTP